jgi:hypothetical protein
VCTKLIKIKAIPATINIVLLALVSKAVTILIDVVKRIAVVTSGDTVVVSTMPNKVKCFVKSIKVILSAVIQLNVNLIARSRSANEDLLFIVLPAIDSLEECCPALLIDYFSLSLSEDLATKIAAILITTTMSIMHALLSVLLAKRALLIKIDINKDIQSLMLVSCSLATLSSAAILVSAINKDGNVRVKSEKVDDVGDLKVSKVAA